MTQLLADADLLVALGAFAGAQVLVVIFSVIQANVHRERAYLLHAAATITAVLAVQALAGSQPLFPQVVLLLVMAFAVLQLRDLVTHASTVRGGRGWMLGVGLVLMPVMALLSALTMWVLVLGVVVWAGLVGLVMVRGWRQCQPWIWWLIPGFGGLAAAAGSLSWRSLSGYGGAQLPVSALLTLWTACVYLGTGWRNRMAGESRARMDARSTVDPVTGLSMPIVLVERVHAARLLVQRYGHPSALLLIHIENMPRLAAEYGLEVTESAMQAAAIRVRQSLREGDVAARLTHSRIAVLAEGLAPPEAAGNVASRILVAGLKEPLPALPAEFLHFRVVLAGIPPEEVPARVLLQRMGARLDQELQAPSERRIVTLNAEELLS